MIHLKKQHWIGIIFSIILSTIAIVFFLKDELFYFLIGISTVILTLPFILSLVLDTNREREKNERFLEFARNLAESVKSGTPISQSILNMKSKNFGSLTPHVRKLANQISMGLSIKLALNNFAKDINSNTISRAISLIREAESAGGKISDILDSVAHSVYQIEKLKKERKAAIYNLVVQGYIIFFIFIGIMLVMQFKILPLTAGVGNIGTVDSINTNSSLTPSSQTLARPFLYLLLVQGIFTGFTIGKLAEGSIKAGIKHSFILTLTAFLIGSGANAFL